MKSWYEDNIEIQKKRSKASNIKGRRENRIAVLDYLRKHPCIDCGNADIEVLEFDHRDASTKRFAIGDAIRWRYGWETIADEIAKCDVRCANCHRKRSRKQLGWWRDIVENSVEDDNLLAT